jgi:hypothetical protein
MGMALYTQPEDDEDITEIYPDEPDDPDDGVGEVGSGAPRDASPPGMGPLVRTDRCKVQG